MVHQTRQLSSEETAVLVQPAIEKGSWAAILEEAVRTPGLLHKAYRAFHNYSLGNQVLAVVQCYHRNLAPGPINTYPGWQRLGRQVMKGEKALVLCMPVTTNKHRNDPPSVEREDQQEEGTAHESEATVTRFVFRNNWFVLSQTEGEPYQLPAMQAWEKAVALETLEVQEVPFVSFDGNSQGYAQGRSIAINPVAALPYKTLFHELAHIMLGHTTDETFKEARPLNEAEAELVALLCLESLGLPGTEYSRGYVQHWLNAASIPERSAQRIFRAADMILKAGTKQNIEPDPMPQSGAIQ